MAILIFTVLDTSAADVYGNGSYLPWLTNPPQVPSWLPIFQRRCLLLGDAALLGKGFSPLHQLPAVPAAPDAGVVGASKARHAAVGGAAMAPLWLHEGTEHETPCPNQ